MATLGWVTAHLGTCFARSWLIAILVAGLAGLGVAINDGVPWLVAILVIAFLATVALSRTLDRDDRGIALGLFGWALACRLVIVLILTLVSTEYAAGGLLSPDGAGYLSGSRALDRSGFDVGSPFAFFGTYDIGQYYVFAALLKAFGSDFTVLAVFNAAVGALAAPFAFAWARLTIPKHAVLVGSIAALSPSLALLATTNLLKDPLVILGTLVIALCVAQALREEMKGWHVWLWLALGSLALAFLHTTRFYVAAYLELGLIIVVAIRLLQGRGRRPARTRLLGLLGAILVAELIAGSLGWPTSPILVSSQVQHVAETPAMQPPPQRHYPIPGLAAAVSIGRRVFGPYVWVMPERLDLDYLVLSDFDLYPDTLLWYLVLPFVGIGIALTLASLLANRSDPMTLGYLAIFVCVYLAQYLAINLSYRQREDILPLTLAFVPAGAQWVLARRPGQFLYGGYWVALTTAAAGHLILRSNA